MAFQFPFNRGSECHLHKFFYTLIASAFPDPDPELLQHFPYAYYIEKPHRNITTFADQFGQLADELDEMLSGDATHV